MTTANPAPCSSIYPKGSGLGTRSTADLSSLLVELSRVVKALGFYPDDSPQRRALMERTYLAWQGDLARSGPLMLEACGDELRCEDLQTGLDKSVVDPIAAELAGLGIAAVEFHSNLDKPTFHAFARLLAGDPELDVDPHEWEIAEHGMTAIAQLSDDRDPAEIGVDDPEHADGAADPAADPSELRVLLAAFDDCDADDDYFALSDQLSKSAIELTHQGRGDEAYRVALVLADHAVGMDGRSGVQAMRAQALLEEIASEALLPDLIARASTRPGSEGVRAAQVLLQLGSAAAQPLFDALLREPRRDRAAQLSGLIVALGDRVIETLQKHMKRPSGPQARMAARLAGELQNQALAATLAGLLSSPDPALRKEAARALVLVGGTTAIDALCVALSSSDDDLAELAALCLGELRDPRALSALMRELERSAAAGRLDCAREIVRAVGQIGADEAASHLVALLGLRGFAQRKKRRDLKLASVTALSKLRGPRARAALQAAAAHHDALVRERARKLLSQAAHAATDAR